MRFAFTALAHTLTVGASAKDLPVAGGHLPHGARLNGGGGRATARSRCAGPARGGCLGHAAHRERQHQCADDHDWGEGGGLDSGGALKLFVSSVWERSLVL